MHLSLNTYPSKEILFYAVFPIKWELRRADGN